MMIETSGLKDLAIIALPFLLAIIGFFLISIYNKISEIEKNTTAIMVKHAAQEKRLDGIEHRVKSTEHDVRDIEKRLPDFVTKKA